MERMDFEVLINNNNLYSVAGEAMIAEYPGPYKE